MLGSSFNNALMTGLNNTQIRSGHCYPYSDGGQPERQYLYCFCNNRDFCNGAAPGPAPVWPTLLLPLLASVLPRAFRISAAFRIPPA